MDEFDRIARIFRPLTQNTPEALDLRDDAAWLQPPSGSTLVASADALVAGVHFLGTESPAHIAQKALRVNLSDLAAMGAAPYGYLLTTQLPADVSVEWLEEFAQGLQADQQQFGIKLFGGDSTRTSGPMTFSVMVLGTLAAGVTPLRRATAQIGNAVMVTGKLGASALGLQCIRHGRMNDPLVQRYLLPTPRIAFGQALHGIVTACMDISDGLLQDVGHIARESGVGIVLDVAALPLPDAAGFTIQARYDAALAGGDDYELLFTVPEDKKAEIITLAAQLGIECTHIGQVIAGESVACLHLPEGVSLPDRQGWRHF